MIQVFGCKSSCNSFFSEKLLQRSSSFMSLRETFGCLVITPRDLRDWRVVFASFVSEELEKKRISWEFLSKWILRKFFGRFSPSCCQLNRLLFSIELHRVGRLFLREQNFFNKTLRALCSLSFKQTRSSSWALKLHCFSSWTTFTNKPVERYEAPEWKSKKRLHRLSEPQSFSRDEISDHLLMQFSCWKFWSSSMLLFLVYQIEFRILIELMSYWLNSIEPLELFEQVQAFSFDWIQWICKFKRF